MTAPTELAVSITIGKQTWLAGSIPDTGPMPDEIVRPIVDHLIGTLRSSVAHAAAQIATERDAAAILDRHRAALTLAVQSATETNPTGPIVRVLREASGMTRAGLAKAMGRNRGCVKTWEEGGRSRFTIRDDWMAAEALGFAAGAVLAVYMALVHLYTPSGEPQLSGSH
jgi:DNA-binding transcriptional regulator YiaG